MTSSRTLIPKLIILVFSLSTSIGIWAQTRDYNIALKAVQDEQKSFDQFLLNQTLDRNIKTALEEFNNSDLNKLQVNVRRMTELKLEEKIKGIRSIGYFLKELQDQLQKNQLNVYRVPGLLFAFQQMLPAFLQKKSTDPFLSDLDWRTTQVLANALWQFDEKKHIEDLSTFRRLVKTPEHILPFLERTTDYTLRDSLIYYYGTHFPDQLILYLKKKDSKLSGVIEQHPDIFIRQIASFSTSLNAAELAPFTELLVQNRISVDSILSKRKKVIDYFQLLVNTIIDNKSHEQSSAFQKALYNAVHEKSLSFYAKEINMLHSSPDAVRFASVKGLRPEDLYYIIVSCDNELYTSTYLGLYRRLMEFFKGKPADSLFGLVHYDQFRKFVRIAAGYNTLDDFLKRMPVTAKQKVLHDFISGINNDAEEDDALQDAVDVADAFISFSQDPELNGLVQQELNNSLEKCRNENSFQCLRLYSILDQLYRGLNKEGSIAITSALENYEQLSVDQLKNSKGEIIEMALFYGDDDGKASFKNFMNLFKDTVKWKSVANDSWVTIQSLQGQPIAIYANLPLSNEEEKDDEAQTALTDYLKKESIEPAVLIHRGHSYHLKQTLKQLSPSVKLAILGSCGGYNNIQKIMTANADMQVIASKQTGSMFVNDPMLNAINAALSEEKDVNWSTIWMQLGEKFKNETEISRLFREYVPPYKNISLFVYRLYNNVPQSSLPLAVQNR